MGRPSCATAVRPRPLNCNPRAAKSPSTCLLSSLLPLRALLEKLRCCCALSSKGSLEQRAVPPMYSLVGCPGIAGSRTYNIHQAHSTGSYDLCACTAAARRLPGRRRQPWCIDGDVAAMASAQRRPRRSGGLGATTCGGGLGAAVVAAQRRHNAAAVSAQRRTRRIGGLGATRTCRSYGLGGGHGTAAAMAHRRPLRSDFVDADQKTAQPEQSQGSARKMYFSLFNFASCVTGVLEAYLHLANLRSNWEQT